ncbi:MAG: DUF6095 family protein [Lutibacter sp.]|uniref:DUF6095 family protein n=1 Tax=Lutibacter sp. TaxID=1925666 RepID=UPI00385EA328
MRTNKNELIRGLKYELATFPLLILGPILITIGLKAIKQQHNYLWFTIGVCIAITAIILFFLGIRIILNAFFDDK